MSDLRRAELRRDRDADVRYYVGSTGSGKTWAAARDVKRERRALVRVWDFKDDHHTLPTARALVEFVHRAQTAERVLRYVPTYRDIDRQFDIFCRTLWAVQSRDPSRDCLVVVEELSKVTRPGCVPEWWHNIIELGRVYGFTVVGTTQRPAYVDLSFRGAATLVRCGRLGEEADARNIGARIGVPYGGIQRLLPKWAYECGIDGRARLVKPKA